MVPFFHAWLELSGLPWQDYITQRDKLLAPLAARDRPWTDWIFYNPRGQSAPEDVYAYDEYIRRLHEMDDCLSQLQSQAAKVASQGGA